MARGLFQHTRLVSTINGFPPSCQPRFWAIISMMDQIQVGQRIIRCDTERTRKAYAAMERGDAERCGCSYCRNFAAQRSTVYPENFRLLLDQLGIDPEKEGEVYECGPEDSLRIYGGWFYFAGELTGPDERVTDANSVFEYWFADAKHYPVPVVDFGNSVMSVQFVTKLPWIISDQP